MLETNQDSYIASNTLHPEQIKAFSTDYNIVLNEAKVLFINSSCSIDCGSHYRVEIISLSFVCPTVGNNGYNLIGVKLLNDETNVLDELSCAHK